MGEEKYRMSNIEKDQANLTSAETQTASFEHSDNITEQDREPLEGASVAKSGMPAWPWMLVSVIAVAALIFVLLRTQSSADMNAAVAKMDGASITKADLYDEMVKQMGEDRLAQVVGGLSDNKLIALEADKADAAVSDAEIQKEIDKIKTSMGGDEQFSQALEQYGMTLDTLKEQILPGLQLRKIFEKQNPVKEQDLKAYFDKNKEMFATSPKEVKASHILVSTQEEADAVLAELKAGKDFAALAKDKSTDGSKDNGGDLGFFGRGQMDPQFEEAAFALGKGELSEVVQSQFGFHIIKVTDIKEAVVPAFEEKKEDVKMAYLDEQVQTKRDEWMDKVKKERNYQNLLEKKPEPAATPAPTATATEQAK